VSGSWVRKSKTRLLIYFISISFFAYHCDGCVLLPVSQSFSEKWFYPFPEVNEVKRKTLSDQNRTLHETASLVVMLLNKQSAPDRQAVLDQLVAAGQMTGFEVSQTTGQSWSRVARNYHHRYRKTRRIICAGTAFLGEIGDRLRMALTMMLSLSR